MRAWWLSRRASVFAPSSFCHQCSPSRRRQPSVVRAPRQSVVVMELRSLLLSDDDDADISSSSDDGIMDDDFSMFLEPAPTRLGIPNRPRDRMDWSERMNSLTEFEFKRTYRQSSERFHSVVAALKERDLSDRLIFDSREATHNAISMELRWSMTSRFLAGGSYLDIYQMHGVSKSAFFECIWKTLDLFDRAYPVPWILDNPVECAKLSAAFQQRSAVPGAFGGCVGAIDGLCVKIKAPTDRINPAAFWARKGFYAVNVQAICDASRKFLFWSCKAPGRTNDNLALCFTPLGRGLMTPWEDLPPLQQPIYPGYYVHGDLAYGCTRYIICPYKGTNLSKSQDAFNFYHSQLRINIECAFGMLVRRFGILWRPMEFALERCAMIVNACMKLHNLLVDDSPVPDQLRGRVVDANDVAASMPELRQLLPAVRRVPDRNAQQPIREAINFRLSREIGVVRPKSRKT